MKLESIVEYLDAYLTIEGHPDYGPAHNGLQVAGDRDVRSVAAAVDASVASIEAVVGSGAGLMVVHHGIFWGGSAPITGPLYRRLRPLLQHGVALYSAHLPLDAHAEVGNCALLADALGLTGRASFAGYKGVEVGWWGTFPEPRSVDALSSALADAVGGSVHVIPGGPKQVRRVGVVTGGGASFLREAAELGLDALVTGEAPHHAYIDAMEAGIHVLLGGHYATETFGVKALAAHVAERFDLEWHFIDQPSGL
ncbi:MAG: Nif3-like dinuclear metal center hexameric protein [Gemmatimonadota bacterium]